MHEDNADRKPFIPSTPTIDWVIALYFEEVANYTFTVVAKSERFYKFLWYTVLAMPVLCLIVIAQNCGEVYWKSYILNKRVEESRERWEQTHQGR